MRLTHYLALGLLAAGCQSSPDSTATRHGSLGASTRAPSDAEAEAMALPFDVRRQGQTIASVVPGGAASRAGLKPGDVVLSLNDNTLYSQDDVQDFLRASDPGASIDIHLRRAGRSTDTLLPVELGTSTDAPAGPTIDWEYASLAQLPAAQDKALAEKRRLLVGLSGAET